MIYVDTSFVALLMVDQPHSEEAEDLFTHLIEHRPIVSSALLQVELCRVARRLGLPLNAAISLLQEISLLAIDQGVLDSASRLTGELKSLDALHLATALSLDTLRNPVEMLTCDLKLAHAARGVGLQVIDFPA